MKMLRDRPKLFGHRQVHIFVYQPVDRQLTTQADLSNVWGQKKDTITNCQTIPGRKLVQNSGCFFFNNFKGEKSNANNGKPTRNYTFCSEDRSILRAEATFSLSELSCEKYPLPTTVQIRPEIWTNRFKKTGFFLFLTNFAHAR